MIRCLEAEGVPVIFGYPGAAIAPFYDSLPGSSIRHILTRGEQSAGHAASGWARLTGRPGVCVSTSGPGATNLFTAIATAYSDSIPLVAITGQVATHLLGRDVFQEVDTTGAVEPFTKYSYLIKQAEDLPRAFKEAFYLASTGRKGPVLIDVPVDVQKQLLDFHYPDSVQIRGYKPCHDGHALQVRKVAEAISGAKRPLLCCGGGVLLAGAQDGVRRLCERSAIPAVTTMMGISAIPPRHPLNYGMLGQSGSATANTAVRESDLLVLIGARVGDRAITQPEALERDDTVVVHIDIDTAEIGKMVGTTIPLVGDAARVVEQLLEKDIRGDWAAWTAHLDALRREEAGSASRPAETPGTVHPGAFVEALCKRLPQDSVYVADVGQNQIWSAAHYTADGRFLTTGGMGTMGYSLPAAIGAKLSGPDRLVVAVCGDGGFQMSMNELATLCQHGVPVKMVVMRNGKLGLVREIQQNSYGGREVAVDLSGSPDFGKIAEAYGIGFSRINAIGQAEEAIGRLLEDKDAPYLLEVAVDPKEGTV